MRAVVVLVHRVVVVGVEIPAAHVVDEAVVVVVDAVAGDFAGVDGDVVGEVGVRPIHAGINHGDDHRGGAVSGVPSFEHIHVGIGGAVDAVDGLAGVVERVEFGEVGVVGRGAEGIDNGVLLGVAHERVRSEGGGGVRHSVGRGHVAWQGDEEHAGEGGVLTHGASERGGEGVGFGCRELAHRADEHVVGNGDGGSSAGIESSVGAAAKGLGDAQKRVFCRIIFEDADAGGGAVGVDDGLGAAELGGAPHLLRERGDAEGRVVGGVNRVGELDAGGLCCHRREAGSWSRGGGWIGNSGLSQRGLRGLDSRHDKRTGF